MKPILEQLPEFEERLKDLENKNIEAPQPHKPWMKIKIPRKIKRKVKKDDRVVVVYLANNKVANFVEGELRDGLIWVNNKGYEYDASAVYIYKKLPLVVIPEWRISPAGGNIDRALHLFGGKQDADKALEEGLHTHAEQTIIRIIKSNLYQEDGKKKMQISWVWWIIGGIAGVYVLAQALTGGV